MQAVAVRGLLRVEHRGLQVGDRQARAAATRAQLASRTGSGCGCRRRSASHRRGARRAARAARRRRRHSQRTCSNSSVSQKIDAVSASAIGSRRCSGVRGRQHDVVERVAELVRERRDRILAAVEVHHDAAHVAAHAHAVRAALLALARSRRRPTAPSNARSARPSEVAASSRRTRRARDRSRPATRSTPAWPDGREQVPPRQPAVVTEEPGLGAQVAPEVGQRLDDRSVHRVERRPVDVVGAQRGFEVVGEAAPAVRARRARPWRRSVRRPAAPRPLPTPRARLRTRRDAGRASAWVASPRASAIGTRSELPSVVRTSTMSCDEMSPCSRCHASDPDGASSPASDSSCSLIWSAAPSAAFRNANSCSAASGLRAMSSSASERREPRAESLAERRERRAPSLELDVARRGEIVAAVGRGQRVEVHRERTQLVLQLVGRREHRLERGDVGVGDRARCGVADVELVVERDQAVDARVDAFERAGERAVVESGEDRGEIPAGRRLGSGHARDGRPAATRRTRTSGAAGRRGGSPRGVL